MKRLFLLILFCAFVPLSAHAQKMNQYSQKLNIGQPIAPTEPGQDTRYEPPVEPNIPPVKFLKPDPPASLRERVEQLLYGIKVDIPPEYDHFGYEMRRYMAHVAGPDVLGNETRLQEELKNIRKAKIILKFWREELFKQMSALEKDIAAQKPSADVLTGFKYNSGIARAFLAECQAWLDKNEAMLQYLADRQGLYEFKYPEFTFQKVEDRMGFATRFKAAREARDIINDYVPFAIMVY